MDALQRCGVIGKNLQYIVPEEVETILLPEKNADPFTDPDGFMADLKLTEWFWKKLWGEKPLAVQYANGGSTTVISQWNDGASYRVSVFDNRGPMSHREVTTPEELLRETQNWHGEIEVLR